MQQVTYKAVIYRSEKFRENGQFISACAGFPYHARKVKFHQIEYDSVSWLRSVDGGPGLFDMIGWVVQSLCVLRSKKVYLQLDVSWNAKTVCIE